MGRADNAWLHGMFYDTTDKFSVPDEAALREYLASERGAYYVYVLCYPTDGLLARPFYVGIGQGERLFAHEREVSDQSVSSAKVNIIRGIQAASDEVLRLLDSVHVEPPWAREQQLIDQFGLLKDGSGVLANEQRYSVSLVVDGVELRKYAVDGNELPQNFIRRDSRLVVGARRPANSNSVYGKIYAALEKNPGVTGAELVELLLDIDFSNNQTIYARTGQVSRPWLAKYIDGGFYKKNQYIAEM